jgi:hypothetical protein
MGELSVRMVVPMAMKKLVVRVSACCRVRVCAYPKVAADPIMYCPSVRSIPFGPGPKRTMLVKPGLVREALRESRMDMRTEDESNDQADSCSKVRLLLCKVQAAVTYIHPSCHPSSLRAVSGPAAPCEWQLHTLVYCGRATRPLRH